MDTFSITLPNGATMRDIPVGTTHEQIKARALQMGIIKEEDFGDTPTKEKAPLEVPEVPLMMRDRGEAYQPPVEEQEVDRPATIEGQLERIDNTPTTPITGREEQAVEVRRVGPSSDTVDEIKRSWWGNLVLPAAQAALDFWNMGAEVVNGGQPVSEETRRNQQEVLLEQVRALRGEVVDGAPTTTVIASKDGQKSAFQLDENGRVVTDRAQTIAGEILPYFVPGTIGFKAVASANILRGLSQASRIGVASVASANISGQLITDPYAETLANVVETYLAEGSQSTLLSYLAMDEEDEMYVRRLKMMGQDTILGLFIDGGIVGTSKFTSWLKGKAPEGEIFKKADEQGIKSLSENELGDFFYEFMKDTKAEGRSIVDIPTGPDGKPIYIRGRPNYQMRQESGAGVYRPEFLNQTSRDGLGNVDAPLGTGVFTDGMAPPLTPEVRQLADAELAQIAAQTGNGIAPNLRRFYQQVITSRGYWTDSLFNLKNLSEGAKRGTVNQAEGAARRMNISLDKMVRQALDPSNPYKIPNVTNREEASAYFQDQVTRALRGQRAARSRLSQEVLTEVDAARASIDSLSLRLASSPTIFNEFKDDIINNVGSYLKRSFEVFENPNYVANRGPATEYFRRQLLRDGLNADEAASQAAAKVDGILADAKEGWGTFLTNAQRLNNNIYGRRGDIPAPIRQLLGEITDPSRNIVLTTTRLANFVETDKFLREFDEIGTGTFVLDAPTGPYSAKIQGTNSALDGRYTTPELRTALENQQSRWGWMDSDLIRSLATYKATTQAAKTVLSHTTHVKNALGGTMTRMANGSLPFDGQTADAFRVVYNNARGNGDTGLDALAEEYIRRGIMSTNVGVRELRDLMDLGYGDPEGLLRWANVQAEKAGKSVERVSKIGTKGLDKAYSGAEKVYMGVDDFFKISEFESYADTLKKAYPDLADDVIRDMAADVIKDTMFNYDMVPNAIKSLRFMPFGSFVGFPAEVLRTSIKIPLVAFREISSDNQVLAARGYRRLIGWGTTVAGGGSLISYVTGTLNGVTEEQAEALKEYHRTPWSDNPTPWVSRDTETGELLSMDSNTIDTYQYFREPFRDIIKAVQEGSAREEDVLDMVLVGVGNAFKGMVSPFISESMSTELWTDYLSALKSEDGRGISGKLYFEEGKNLPDAMWEGLKVLFESVKPGSMESVEKGFDEWLNDTREWQGDATEPDMIVPAQLGLPLRRVRPENALAFGIRDYASAQRNAPRVSVNYRSTPEDIIKKYTDLNKQMYDAQRELRNKALMAIDLGMSWVDVHNALEGSGLDSNDSREILDGNFIPSPIGADTWDKISREVYHAGKMHSMSYAELRRQMSTLQDTMRFTPLDKAEGQEAVSNAPQALEQGRVPFSQGGVVVPNAPMFPAQRVDKLTGLPYFLQAGQTPAGGGLMDALKAPRASFQAGGIVKALAKKFLGKADEAIPPGTEYREGVEKFGQEGMTTEARMARGDEMGFDPTTAYHGTAADVDEFRADFLGELTAAESAKMGFFFTRSPSTPKGYAVASAMRAEQAAHIGGPEVRSGANILPVRLRTERPKIVEMNHASFNTAGRPSLSKEIAQAKEEGYDSVIFRDFSDLMTGPELEGGYDKAMREVVEGEGVNEALRGALSAVQERAKVPYEGQPNSLATEFEEMGLKLDSLRKLHLRGTPRYLEAKEFFSGLGVESNESIQQLAKELSEVEKRAHYLANDYTDHIVVFEPNQIRSVNATFDPAHRDSGNLLRATSAAPVGGILEALRQASQVKEQEDI